MPQHTVLVHVWTGDPQQAVAFAQARYPGAAISFIAHRELRANGVRAQFQALRRLKAQALVYYFRAAEDNKQPELLIWTHLLHRCRETVVAYGDGTAASYRWIECARRLPGLALNLSCDLFRLTLCWVRLKWVGKSAVPPGAAGNHALDVAYLYPFPLNRYQAGGAISHVTGVLAGLAQNRAACEVYSGCTLPVTGYPVRVVEPARRRFLFGEALMLAYNWEFADRVARALSGRPRLLYQRHGRFVFAGALLARRLCVPLVLEYNGSEQWMSRYWDPTRFGPLLRLCEALSVRAASHIVVVSEPLRQELLARGVPAERILVNPNGVDPGRFRPGCGGNGVRRALDIAEDECVIAFLGSFSYWHGIETLQEATCQLLQAPATDRLRFLFIGEGPLHAAMETALREFVEQRRVVFTGLVAHAGVNRYLDAADILVSPHVPMPDGQPLISSPTKLFEYMAAGKAIVASNIGQLAEILVHMETALLVTPGDPPELAAAISYLAAQPEVRLRLGRNARAAAIARHTWKQNAARVLSLAGAACEQQQPSLAEGRL